MRQKRSRKYLPKHKKASNVRPLDIINVSIAIVALISQPPSAKVDGL